MSAANKLRKLAEVSVGQWGLITTAQAEKIGVDRLALSRLSQNGHLERVRQGVYRDTGVALTELTFLQAEWLMIKPDVQAQDRIRNLKDEVAVGSTTATWLYQAGDFRPTPFIFFSSRKIQRASKHVRTGIRHITPEEITLVQGLPTTTPERTIQDLFREGLDFAGVRQVAADLRQRIQWPSRLQADVAHFHKNYGLDAKFFSTAIADALQINRVTAGISGLEEQSRALSNQLALIAAQLPKIEQNPALEEVVENLKHISAQINSLSLPRHQEQDWQIRTKAFEAKNP
jgi:predicted transcriptional regulator of viral defense system